MRTKLKNFIFIFLLIPSVAFASEGEHHGIDSLTWYYINAAVFFSFIFYVLRKPCKEAFLKRREGIKANVDEANKVYTDALNALNSAKAKHEHLEEELQKISDDIITEAKEQAQHIVQVAESRASYLQATAKQMIEAEEKKALKNLSAEFSKILVQDTINDVKSSINEELDRKLIVNGVEKIN